VSFLLDTNVLSETRKPRCNPGVTEWIAATSASRMHLSTLTIGEVGQGIAQLQNRGDHRQAAVFEEWLDDVIQAFDERIVPVTLDVAQAWGTQSLERPVSPVDGLIAATANVHGWTLVTRNTKDFEHTGVRLLNPFID